MEFESKLIPIMREGVDVVKMIFFRKLKDRLSSKYPRWQEAEISLLAGAILNDLFGIRNPEEPFASFRKENGATIEAEMSALTRDYEEMQIPLTDALRIQFLCDSMEDLDSSAILSRAQDLGVLLVERDLPLPHNFLNLVRRLGSAFHLLAPIASDRQLPGV